MAALPINPTERDRERLRKKAQNEATCILLNDMLRDAQEEVRRLRDENERQKRISDNYYALLVDANLENERLKADAEWMNGNIVDLRKSLARYREREMTMGWNQE